MSEIAAIIEALLVEMGASRVTLRRGVDDGYAFPVTDEALAHLPVSVPGSLLSIGDLHFAQGDGEVCGTGIEVAGSAAVRVSLQRDPPWRPRYPAYETPARPARRCFATTGIPVEAPMDLTAAARVALLEMIGYLEAARGFERAAAYALCSVAVDLRISEVVDVPYPLVSALLPLDLFDEGQEGRAAQSRSGTA